MKRTAGIFLTVLTVISFAAPVARAADAKAILEATGVRGGLVVHVGCGDGKLTAALRANERYVVQGLARDEQDVEKAREHIQSLGLYGPVSVAHWEGRTLPYVDNLVNLVVSEDAGPGAPGMKEVMRVLAPNGVAYVRKGGGPGLRSLGEGGWTKTVKPRPAEIDEWSHFLHDASGNAVANDRQIGPPKRLRWVAGPRWCRSHEFPSSVGAVVTAGGRIFTIFDEGPTGVYKKLPQQCKLIARDAASGVLLWKAPLQQWQPEFGTGTGNRLNIHHTIPRRVVADGDRVYVTLRFLDSPVSVLDAATGEVLTKALPGTKGADELILSDGVLIVKATKGLSEGMAARIGRGTPHDTLAAVDVKTGKLLWRKAGIRVLPYALAALGRRVVYHNMDELVCLDARSGKDAWRTPNRIASTTGGVSNLVLHGDVALYHGHGEATGPAGGKTAPKAAGKKGRRKPGAALFLTSFSLDDGKVLWRQRSNKGWGAAGVQPADLFVAGGLVWCASFQGRDLRTGRVKKTVSVDKLISPGHHYRCHRSKATERYLILPKRGAEFVDIEGGNHMRNDWLRSPCFTGLTPANGLLYVPPSQCFCYPGVNVPGYLAMSAKPADRLKPAAASSLHRGSAYGKVSGAGKASAGDWPMYRRDVRRSGSTKTPVPAQLGKQWEVELSGRVSQPVVVGERLWLAQRDAHRIRCLNASNGQAVWSFTAGGRVDSSPTVVDGMVLFGCRDGSVYCLRATDGALVWRFRAAPARQVMSYGQVESVWPIHGSVLVQDGVVYFAAGRSSFLDGGIIVYGLDAKTGKVLHHHLLEGPWPDIRKDTGRPFAMEGALPDLLVSDGRDLYMGRIKFDAQLNRLKTRRESDLGELDMGANHLVATGGFLDDTGFDRLYWMYSRRWPGFYFAQHSPKAGQLVVFDDSTTYAVKHFYRRIVWSPVFYPGEQGALLFADDNDNQPTFLGKDTKVIDWLPKGAATDKHRRGGRGVEKGTGYVREKPAKWQEMIPLRARAMVLAGEHLILAGPPDVVPRDDPLAAFEGRRGAVLWVVAADSGRKLAEYKLDRPVAFDGMIAVAGRVYLTTEDGRLICMAKK